MAEDRRNRRSRRADALAGEGSFSDALRRRREAIQNGNLEKARRIMRDIRRREDNED